MKLNKDNAYVGAEVKKDGKSLYILKVNDKTFYASPYENIIEKWENRLKGVTFKSFISGNNCKKYSYDDGFTIDKKIAEKKDEVVEKKERRKKIKRFLKKNEERFMFDAIRKFQDGKKPLSPLEVSSKTFIYPLVFNQEKKQLLFRKDMEYIVFSEELDEYKKWGDLTDIKAKEENIPWFD